MKPYCLAALVAAATLIPALSQKSSPFAGRWDLTVTTPKATYPSWMEVVEKEGNLEVRAQQREGSVHPVAAAKVEGSRLLVTVSAAAPARPASEMRPAAPAQPEFTWEFTAANGKLSGVQKRGGREEGRIAGVLAPALKRPMPAAWSNPEPLFNGKDLTGWVTINNTDNPKAQMSHWSAKDGELVNDAQGHNIMTKRKFQDFKLHVEFNMEPRANSGIYLRGRYECQMPPPGAPRGGSGRGPAYAIYGFVPVIAPAPGNPGEWRTYDITFVGRTVTLVVNGTTIVDNQEIPGITGGALDSHEGEPGPILFQGDHTGGIRYRNITIALPKR